MPQLLPLSSLVSPQWGSAPTLSGARTSLTQAASEGMGCGDVVIGIISVDSIDAHALFDSGASLSFVSLGFIGRASLCV